MRVETLTREELNRATLARQMLLSRERTTALRAIERLDALPEKGRAALSGEGSELLRFVEEDAEKFEVRIGGARRVRGRARRAR